MVTTTTVANTTSTATKPTKGLVTKWEKKWVSVGHLKLLKWTALKPKKLNVQSSSKPKDGASSTVKTSGMETRQTRSKRGTAGTGERKDEEIEMLYWSSLPKTRRTAKKLETMQKKIQDLQVPEDTVSTPGGGGESSTGTTTKLNIKRKIVLSNKGSSTSLTSPPQPSQQGGESGDIQTPSTQLEDGETTSTTTTTTTSTTTTTDKSGNLNNKFNNAMTDYDDDNEEEEEEDDDDKGDGMDEDEDDE